MRSAEMVYMYGYGPQGWYCGAHNLWDTMLPGVERICQIDGLHTPEELAEICCKPETTIWWFYVEGNYAGFMITQHGVFGTGPFVNILMLYIEKDFSKDRVIQQCIPTLDEYAKSIGCKNILFSTSRSKGFTRLLDGLFRPHLVEFRREIP